MIYFNYKWDSRPLPPSQRGKSSFGIIRAMPEECITPDRKIKEKQNLLIITE